MVTVLLAALDRGENHMAIIGCKFNMRARLRAIVGHYKEDGNDAYSVAVLSFAESSCLARTSWLEPNAFFCFRYKDTFLVTPTTPSPPRRGGSP